MMPSTRRLTRLVFALILSCFGLAAGFVAAEVVLRALKVPVADDPFVRMGFVAPYLEETTLDGEPALRVTHHDVYRERNIVFPVQKPANTFRVFSFGGSASAGWPHPPERIYTEFLRAALARAYPDRNIEVINLGAHAFAAYRVRLVFNQVIDYDPDLVIIYSGNNEFLERRRYPDASAGPRRLERFANRSVLFRLVAGSRWLFPNSTLDPGERGHVAFEQWSKIERVVLNLRHDPVQYRWVQDHYTHSIRSMLEAATDRGVPVFLLSVPVNLRDWIPNVSTQPLDGDARVRWEQSYRAGRASLLAGAPTDAVERLREAAALNPEHADTRFYLGHAVEGLGQREDAHRAFSEARDLDRNPFRAPSVFNEILQSVAGRVPGVRFIDAARAFRENADRSAPGFDLFLDYVHPTSRGNLLLARLVFDEIVAQRLVSSEPSRPGGLPDSNLALQLLNAETSDLDMQATLVELSLMMHQHRTALEKARAIVAAPGAAAVLNDTELRMCREAVAVLPDVLAIEEADVRGHPVTEEYRAGTEARLQGIYRAFWGDRTEFETDLRGEQERR
jgi:tetratricopeptide (TPR) repeat protein